MKMFLIGIALVAFVCIAGLLVGKALFTGESFPHPIPKNVTVVLPFSPRSLP